MKLILFPSLYEALCMLTENQKESVKKEFEKFIAFETKEKEKKEKREKDLNYCKKGCMKCNFLIEETESPLYLCKKKYHGDSCFSRLNKSTKFI